MLALQLAFPGGIELLIFGLVYLIVPFILAWWVYNDANQRQNEHAALWALAVGGLTYLTFFGGFLALAVYIWDRD